MALLDIRLEQRTKWPPCQRCGHSMQDHMDEPRTFRMPGNKYPCHWESRNRRSSCICRDYFFSHPGTEPYHRVHLQQIIWLDMKAKI